MDFADKAFVLEIDRDKMFADIVCVDGETKDSFVSYDSAVEAVTEAKIVQGVKLEVVREACDNVEKYEINTFIRIADGEAPQKGEDGRIDFTVDVSGVAQYKGADEGAENIDFKKATKVACIQRGGEIARVIPPVQGTPGRDIFGANIPAPKPREPSIRAGMNVDYNTVNHICFATMTGRPVFHDSVLSVLPIYEVTGDVDYNTGHIDFDGTVIVTGAVLDDFCIKAKEVVVYGTVGGAEIIAESNIAVHSGIAGKDKARIIAGGIVHSKYISNAYVESLGDVVVAREIVHSTIITNGKVVVNSLMGGHVMAKLGVTVTSLGSELGVSTRVEPGVDLEVRKVENALDIIDQKIEVLLKPVQLFWGERAKYKAVSSEKKEEIKKRFGNFKRLFDAHMQLARRRSILLSSAAVAPNKVVNVRKILHHDTIVCTDLCMRNFSTEATGPLMIVEDIDHSTMTICMPDGNAFKD